MANKIFIEMSSLDFWEQVKEGREILKKNKVDYQTMTISDDIFNMLYKDAEILEILKKKKVNLFYVYCYKEVNGYNTFISVKNKLTQKEFKLIKEWLENDK